MISPQLDSAGDLVISGGTMILGDYVAQRVATRLRTLLGEWFLDTTEGTPYLQRILVSNVNLDNVRSIIRSRVLGTVGVQSIQAINLTFDAVRRKLTVVVNALGPKGAFQVAL